MTVTVQIPRKRETCIGLVDKRRSIVFRKCEESVRIVGNVANVHQNFEVEVQNMRQRGSHGSLHVSQKNREK